MKKFYAIALAAAVALSASAERYQLSGEAVKTKTHALTAIQAQHIKNIAPLKAPAKVTAAEVEGLQYWYATGLLKNQSTIEESVELKVDDASTGAATLVLAGGLELEATVDLAANTVTIPNMQYIGEDADGPFYFYLKDVSDEGSLVDGASADASVTGTYEEGNVIFPVLSVWAVGDPDAEDLGWYYLTYDNVFTTEEIEVEPVDPYENYELIGKGTYLENIMYPFFFDEENTEAVEVDIYELKDDPNIILIANPLKALYEKGGLGDYTSPDLELDLTDPEDVFFELTNSGIGDNTVGAYFYGSSSFFYDWGILDEEDVVKCTYTEVDGLKTVVIPQNATVIMTSKTYDLYWGSMYESVLIWGQSSGVDNITIDQNAPAVYYNLQGVRVNNPANGVFVRVQNGKATKIVK